MNGIKNIPLNTFRRYLVSQGLKEISTKGGHQKWSRKDLSRPVILQSHIEPVPIHVIKSNLRTLSVSLEDLLNWISNN